MNTFPCNANGFHAAEQWHMGFCAAAEAVEGYLFPPRLRQAFEALPITARERLPRRYRRPARQLPSHRHARTRAAEPPQGRGAAGYVSLGTGSLSASSRRGGRRSRLLAP